MITRTEAYEWLDRQVDAMELMGEPLGAVENMRGSDKEFHIYNFEKLIDILGCPFVRAYHTENTDELYFNYRGVKFFGLSWEKRIGKKAS